MKTNLFLGLALLSMAPNAVSAQENADSLYIRNSVYMLCSSSAPFQRTATSTSRL